MKAVEPIVLIPHDGRKAALERAGYNVFGLRSEDVFVDLLTDSGTSAMSAEQWAGIQSGDEAYAGARNWYHLQDSVRRITGFPHVIPVHQGRGAETVYTRAFVQPGDVVLGNLHFDTTGAHIRNRGAEPVDVLCEEGFRTDSWFPFKGNADLAKAERVLAANPGRVKLFVLTVTANTNGGQPVSLANARDISAFCRRHGIGLIVDAARFAENAYLIREREPGQSGRTVGQIARSLFDLADGMAMSAKKDALTNIGGFLALRDAADFEACRKWAVLYEGYLTYGGMAGRDLEALSVGLQEGLNEDYLGARIRQVRLLHELIAETAAPVVRPPGGHSVVLDAAQFLDHLQRDELPAEALAAALYLEGGVRSAALGGLAFGRKDPDTGTFDPGPWEFVRLAIPRRVYTDNQMAYVAEVTRRVWEKREQIRGLRAAELPEELPHFTARFEPLRG